jgi:hypothetical protein
MATIINNQILSRLPELLDPDATHIGIGTGTAPGITGTVLGNETLRKSATGFTDNTTLVKEIFFDTGEANGVLFTETGLFGKDATSSIDTGTLFLSSDLNIEKTNTESLTVSYEITFRRA